jgi:hypothetical protein
MLGGSLALWRQNKRTPPHIAAEFYKPQALISDIVPDAYAGLIPFFISSMCVEANEQLSTPFT